MHRNEAEEHLRIIRSLMEKATIYRAISAPTALVAGVLALGAAIFGMKYGYEHAEFPEPNMEHLGFHVPRFIVLWFGVLGLTVLSNGILLFRDARRRGEKFISPGMKMAVFAMLPAYGSGAFITICNYHSVANIVAYWILFHGIALLATSHFAPKSITVLGYSFLIAGFVAISTESFPSSKLFFELYVYLLPFMNGFGGEIFHNLPHIFLGCTFGLFHLIYAACTWPRGTAKSNA